MVPRFRLYLHLIANQCREGDLPGVEQGLLWLGDDGALVDFPVDEDAFDAGLESRRVFLLGLPCIPQVVAFRHLGLVGVRE